MPISIVGGLSVCSFIGAETSTHTEYANFSIRMYIRYKLRKRSLYSGTEIRNPSGLCIGKGSIIGDNAILDARAGIKIGKNVNLSSNVSIWTLQHDYRDPDFACNPNHYGPVRIENRVWIGPNSIILRNVTIGEGAVVAAGSVVTHNIPPFELWGGVPARSLGKRPQNMRYEFKGTYCHFL